MAGSWFLVSGSWFPGTERSRSAGFRALSDSDSYRNEVLVPGSWFQVSGSKNISFLLLMPLFPFTVFYSPFPLITNKRPSYKMTAL